MTKTFTKKLTKILPTLAVLVAALIPVASASAVDTPWGPERATFTWENPAPYAVFNSITNNPDIGDERNFVRIRELKDGEKYGDEVTLEVGKIYEVYIYYHNNADANDVGQTAIGIADGAAVKSSLPATVKKDETATVTATVFASDTNPLAVWDGAYLKSTRDVYLRYIPGTAIIHNGGALNGQGIGPDYLFGDGAMLGYNRFSGLLPGCNQYAGYITYQFFVDAPDFEIKKSADKSTAKSGEEITFTVRYENTGTMDQQNVVIRDTLPANLTYIEGSAILYNNNFTDGKSVNDDVVTGHGMNIGDYAGGDGWAELKYKAKVSDQAKCNDRLRNSVIVSTTDGNKTASATVVVDAEGCKVVPVTEDEQKPDAIVNTGPAEIVMAVLILIAITATGLYFWRTRHVLKTVEQKVSGKDSLGHASTSQNHTPASENHTQDEKNHTSTNNRE